MAKELLRGQNIKKYLNHIEPFDIPDTEKHHVISDNEALTIISVGKKSYHLDNKKELAIFVRNMHDCGISIRQLSRLTNIPKITIERILK